MSPSDWTRLSLAFLASLALSLTLTPLARWYARRRGFVAKPKADRWHTKPTALLGGPAIALAAVAGFLLSPAGGRALLFYAWIAGAVVISAVGVFDDLRGLRPSSKLIAQIVVALLPISAGLAIPGFHPLLSFGVTLVWIVGITNSFNLLDNMDGLAAGIAAIAALTLMTNAIRGGELALAAAAAAVAGGAVGFLFFNFQPASIFMGDGGSLFLGFSLGTLSLMGLPARPLVSLAVIAAPVFVLAVPIFDTTLVTVLRTVHGRSIAQGGRDHSSHRLVSLGLSERKAVLTLLGISATAGLLSLLLPRLSAHLVVLTLLLAVLAIYYFGTTLGSVPVYGKSPAVVADARARGQFVIDTFIQHKQRIMDVTVDLLLVVISYLSAYLLRYEGVISSRNLELILGSLPILIVARLLAFFAFGLYRTIPGAFSIHDFLAAAKAILVSSAVFVTTLTLGTRFQDFSRAVIVIDAVLMLTGAVFTRVALHSLKELLGAFGGPDRRGVLIVGAGSLGEAAIRLIKADEQSRYRIVGFLDDSPDKIGRSLHGYTVLGPLDSADRHLSDGDVAAVVLASSKIPPEKREALRECCRRFAVDFQEVRIG